MPKNSTQPPDCPPPHVETPRQILEGRMEAAGVRISAYLRHLPVHETQRHELAVEALRRLADNPGENPDQAAANGMRILRDLLAGIEVLPVAIPGPELKRSHMCPEEMDRRPWVRIWMRLWRPLWLGAANILNTAYLDIILYAVLLAVLYFLFQPLRS
ncbi:MAG: hypothetical protein EOL86_10995 [Deltaproteobacteria bacterium]|nr:hypothetical protein [Deltaproteobacteria bacterium]